MWGFLIGYIMKQITYILIIAALLISGCTNNTDVKEEKTKTDSTGMDTSQYEPLEVIQISNDRWLDTILHNPVPIGYNNLTIASRLVKRMGLKSMEDEPCKTWKLEPDDIENIMDGMVMVETMGEWYKSCYQYNCSYEGKITDGKDTFTIGIFAGGYVVLKSLEETRYFITKTKQDKFLAACDCCKD